MLREWVTKKGQGNGLLVTPWELFERDSRIVPLFGMVRSSIDVNVVASDSMPFLAENILAALMLLAQESSDPVKIVINSNGGSLVAGFDIVQAIEHLQAKGIEVWTIDIGAAKSMASTVLAAGTKGKRFAFKRSCVHLHSGTVSTGEQRPEDKEMIDAYLERIRASLNRILTERTKIPEYYVKSDNSVNPELLKSDEGRFKLTRQFLGKEQYLTPEQALEAGIIDQILEPGNPIIDSVFKLQKMGGGR